LEMRGSRSFRSSIQRRSFSTSSSDPIVLTTKKQNYGIISLNRPKANALNGDMFLALRNSLKELEKDKNMRGFVLTSSSPGIFSGGLDLPYLASLNRDQMNDWFHLFNHTLLDFVSTPLLSVAAINGHSPAGGAVLSLTTDYRFMAKGDKFKIGLNEVAVHIIMPPGIIELLTNAVGRRNAEVCGLTGKLMSPEEAHSIGLVDKLTDLDRVQLEAEEYLTKWISSVSPTVVPTKANFKKPIVDALNHTLHHGNVFLDSWFSAESQAFFKNFKASLKK